MDIFYACSGLILQARGVQIINIGYLAVKQIQDIQSQVKFRIDLVTNARVGQ